MKQLFILFMMIFVVSACSSKDKDAELEALEAKTAEEIYSDALTTYEDGKYEKAANLFNEIERLYPYSDFASRAQLLAAKTYYEGAAYDEAVIALDRYIQLYPGSEELDYAYYLRALSSYDQIVDVARDQAMTEEALRNLNLLINRFPESEYARDAQFKKDLVLDHLAGKEMEIGRYYLTRGYSQAGINRFLNVVRDYQTTSHVPEAMHRLVESYLALGVEFEAYRIAAVLGHNYPGSEWYQDTYDLLDPKKRKELLEDRGFVDKAVERIFRPQ